MKTMMRDGFRRRTRDLLNVCSIIASSTLWFAIGIFTLWGHAHLNGHLIIMGYENDCTCNHCENELEMTSHFLCDCTTRMKPIYIITTAYLAEVFTNIQSTYSDLLLIWGTGGRALIAYENILWFSQCNNRLSQGIFNLARLKKMRNSSFSSKSMCKTITVDGEWKRVRGGKCGKPTSNSLSFSITKSVTTKHPVDVTSPHIARGCRPMLQNPSTAHSLPSPLRQ